MANSVVATSTTSIQRCDALNSQPAASPTPSQSSSASSIFSIDAPSSQSSIASSQSLDVVWESSKLDLDTSASDPQSLPGKFVTGQSVEICSRPKLPVSKTHDGTARVEQWTNPRRTKCAVLESGCSDTRAPPSLIRQSDRKVNFVDNLVDSAAQIVETIWPLSVVASRCDASLGSKGVLPLRTFIQETLRRSRTSYSTLQVALYYLILVKSHIPRRDFTMEQLDDGQCARALQCGRRMFLSALILASKYLQDRNYSARAWSKISGLSTQEINTNEMTFLSAIQWRLHISELIFQRWTDIVLKYTPSSAPPPPSPPCSFASSGDRMDWRTIIPHLDADLTDVPRVEPASAKSKSIANHDSSSNNFTRSMHRSVDEASGLVEDAFPAMYTIPRVLEPEPCTLETSRQLPLLRGLGPLPLPLTTALTRESSVPAANTGYDAARRTSIGSALAQAQSASAGRTTADRWTSSQAHRVSGASTAFPSYPGQKSATLRRSSLSRSCSSNSSPESMISDNTSRSSRSSSISSVSSSTCAPTQAKLAVQATCRNAKLQRRIQIETAKPLASISVKEDIRIDGLNGISLSPGSYSDTLSAFSISADEINPLQLDDYGLVKLAKSNASGSVTGVHCVHPRFHAASPTKGRKRSRSVEDSSALQQQVRRLVGLPLGNVACPSDPSSYLSKQSPTR